MKEKCKVYVKDGADVLMIESDIEIRVETSNIVQISYE